MAERMSRFVRSAVCTRCGCACDDVDLEIADGRIVEARNACAVGRPWFLTPLDESALLASVDGSEVEPEEAAASAARLLVNARRPLIWGLIHLSSEAQRVAVRLAERIRGVIDPASGPNHPAAVAAFQEWGEVSAMLGEGARPEVLVVLWYAQVEKTHPRLLERWGLKATDEARVLRLRQGALAEGSWTLPAERELELLWILRELARAETTGELKEKGARNPATPADSEQKETPNAQTGPGSKERSAPGADLRPLAWRLLQRFRAARYVLFVFDAASQSPSLQHALRALAATMNGITRFRLFPLRGAGNRIGAEAVLTWQTGFPVAVDFSSGAPDFNGAHFSASRLLARNEIDAALVVCASPADYAAEPALGRLSELPLVVLDSGSNPLAARARVVLRSAPYGIASGGTFFRMDGLALGLRPALRSRYPTEEEWLSRILSNPG
jgi:formylmethanofuran dehydrogenase subunit B